MHPVPATEGRLISVVRRGAGGGGRARVQYAHPPRGGPSRDFPGRPTGVHGASGEGQGGASA